MLIKLHGAGHSTYIECISETSYLLGVILEHSGSTPHLPPHTEGQTLVHS